MEFSYSMLLYVGKVWDFKFVVILKNDTSTLDRLIFQLFSTASGEGNCVANQRLTKDAMEDHSAHDFYKYSGTPLNGHPSTADTHDITDNSESPDCSLQYLSNPWIADIPLLCTTDSFRSPNCTQTIPNDPDLADTCWSFQQDCPSARVNNLTLD